MTTAEKVEKIKRYCSYLNVDGDGCSECALYGIPGCACYEDSDENIDHYYEILFGADTEDSVNSPKHYADGKIEVIDFIEDKKLGFCLGNAVKYIARAGKKDPTKEVEDLKKARWYIERRIKEIEEGIV